MKIYNIHDTHMFFDKLAACRGMVEMVDEKSGRRHLLHEKGSRDICIPQIYGKIHQIELIFHNNQDMDDIFCWLWNRKKQDC